MITQGKWTVPQYAERIFVDVVGDPMDANANYTIAECYGPDAVSNAALIAAAPDLLEACKAAMRIPELWCPSGEIEEEYLEEYMALNKMFDLFGKAIAKAEGK